MTRTLALVAIGGIATALVCLPLAATLYRHQGGAHPWSWSDHLGWSDDEDSYEDSDDDGKDHGGSGAEIATRDFDWAGADRLELDIPASLHYRPALEWHLSIHGPQRVLDRISVASGRIGMRRSYHHQSQQLDIELSGPLLRDVTVKGSGKLLLDQLRQESLALSIHGSASVRASGSVDTLKLDIMGSGNAQLEQLAAGSSRVFIAGSGDADIAPIVDADIFIAGSGNVRLRTHPKHLSSRIAGSGQVINVWGEHKT
jgi:hypothetical protein